jgi:ankyrin repeat protein
MNQISTLIDPKKKAIVLQRIKDGKAPFCAEKPAPEEIMKVAKKPRKKMPVEEKRRLNEELNRIAGTAGPNQVIDIIRKGANVNYQNENGTSPLMNAACSCNLRVVDLLLRKGAKPGLNDGHGWNAIDYAFHQRDVEKNSSDKLTYNKIIVLLKKYGAINNRVA